MIMKLTTPEGRLLSIVASKVGFWGPGVVANETKIYIDGVKAYVVESTAEVDRQYLQAMNGKPTIDVDVDGAQKAVERLRKT